MTSKSKGNILESITEILERSLSNDSTVITKNKKIEDLDGIVREIDIYVETIVNKRKFNIAIECKHYNEKSRIDMDKIGAFYEKCSRLPFIHKMIFLTTSDYQTGAIKKARTRSIDLYKITKDELVSTGNDLGIDNVTIIEKKCKILGIRFNSEELFKNKIYSSEKLQFYHENKELIHHQFFQDRMIEIPEIWKFLFTKSGIILNQKKVIYPNLTTTNVFTKYGEIYYPVDSIQFTLEIEYRLNPLEFRELKKYHSLTEDSTLAIFSDLEFITNGIKHRFCYVKPTDENEGRFYISTPDKKPPIELKTLAKFKDNPISLSENNKSKLRKN
nr:restriction endonuclease [uncultured Draconibacterium sp.]